MEEIKERRDQGKETEDPRTQMIGTRAEKWIDFIHDELGIQSSRQGAFGSSVRSASSITTPEQAQYDKIEGLIEEVKDLLPGFSPNTTYSPESAREKWGNPNANTQRLNEILKELRSLNATYDDSATILKNKADLLQMTEPLLSSLSIINKALQSNFQI